jgi:hypothetical protein
LEDSAEKAIRALFWNKEGLSLKKRGFEQAILDNQAFATIKNLI